LQEFISTTLKLEHYYEENIIDKYPISIETEKLYYKRLFDSYYPHCEKIVPYFWMPRYSNASDPSARTLEIYDDDSSNKTTHPAKINSIYYVA
jgi:asparagine synthase (glutamine-hydrolysing)